MREQHKHKEGWVCGEERGAIEEFSKQEEKL